MWSLEIIPYKDKIKYRFKNKATRIIESYNLMQILAYICTFFY